MERGGEKPAASRNRLLALPVDVGDSEVPLRTGKDDHRMKAKRKTVSTPKLERENPLTAILSALDAGHDREMKEREDFNAKLRPPDRTYVFGDSGEEWGYWRVERGIVKIRRFKSGYDPRMAILVPAGELLAIQACVAMPMCDLAMPTH
jgi:hypothetical protein